MIHFTFYFTLHCSVLLLVAMATEIYISVRFPLKASIWISMKRTRNIILLLLLTGFILNGHNLMFRDMGISKMDNTTISCDYRFVDKTTQYYSFVQNVHTWIDSTIYCFLPFFTITTLNTLIIRTLFKEARRTQKLAYAITKVLLVLTTLFIFTTGLLALALLIHRISPTTVKLFKFFTISQLLYHSFNVLISMLCSYQFRIEMRSTLFCDCCKHQSLSLNNHLFELT